MVTKESVRELIGDYTAEGFVRILKKACAPAAFVPVGRDCFFGDDMEGQVRVLGVVRDLPGENGFVAPLAVVDVTLSSELTERSSRIRQFKLAKKALEHFAATPPMELSGVISQGVFVFHDATGRFRVSLVTATPENGKFNWSKARRQSFYVTNDPATNATFVQRMCMSWSTLKGIKDAFSVEKLTKEFYDQLFKWYERACVDERVEYPNGLDTDADNREDQNRKHLLRLITRLMFVWFLRQKGLVPKELFDEEALRQILKNFDPVAADQHQYYRAILQNLFFATLNSEIGDREFADSPRAKTAGGKTMTKHHGIKTKYRYADEFRISRSEVLDLFRSIPFLNGGLFECLDQEGEDGKVMYYDGFSQQERHRDLGTLTWAHVPNDLFFNPDYGIIPLLKRYNFTVEENSPGDEDVALDPELLGKVFENLLGAYNPETKEVVRKSTGSFYTPREIVNYMVDESLIAYLAGKTKADEQTVRALVADGIRPSDDALCERLVDALENAKILDPACGSGAFPMGALLKMTELLRILKKLPEGVNLYDLKLKLIENCIFGSDIQEIAVQISKLRVFISLVCEQKPDWSAPNYGINTLPNLETKYVAANSLIGLEQGPDRDLFFESGEIKATKDELWDVRHKHFLAKTRREKNELRRQDKELRTKLADAAKKIGYSEESTRLMASWDPYNQNVHAEFFDPEWMFNVKDGFDIVIGNPPYVVENKNALYDGYYTYKCYELYAYFYEKGIKLLGAKGIIAYITASLFIKGMKFIKLREFLQKETEMLSFRKEGDDAFTNVCMPTCVFIGRKSKNNGWKFEDLDKDNMIISTIENAGIPLASVVSVQRGLEVGRSAECADGEIPILTGSCVRKYSPIRTSHIKRSTALAFTKSEFYHTGERVLVRETGSEILAVYLNEDIYCNRSLYSLKPNGTEFSMKYFVACLNSTPMQFYYQAKYKTETELFPKIRIGQLRQMCIPKASFDQQTPIVALVDRILASKKRDPSADTSALEREIDEKVYRLYGLTDDEIAVVEGRGGASKSEVGTIAPLPDAPKPKKRPPKIKEEF